MRIRRPVVAAGLAVAAIAAFTTSATAAATAAGPSAPTGVEIAWADATQQQIRVTWTDAGEANKVRFQGALGTEDAATVPAGATNEVLVPVDGLYGGNRAVFTVASVDSAGTTGPVAPSTEFDTSPTEDVPITYADPRQDGSLMIAWRDAVPRFDHNPADPFDGPGAVRYTVETGGTRIPVPGNLRFAVVPARSRPYSVAVIAENVWGESNRRLFTFEQPAITGGAIPASAAYGHMLTVSGSVGGQHLVALQARDSASKPWVTLTSRYGDPGAGTFRLQAPSPGTRQYRLYLPARKDQDSAALAYATGVTTSLTRHSIGYAKFSANVVTLGQSVTAGLYIAPETGIRTTLQRWNGKAWVGVKDIVLSKGRGAYTFKTTARGTTAYRFFVPSTTYGGRAITWRTSASIPLVVR
ncbi:hypothetical protein [Kribbella sp. ALI-6-A]|uniref:hypothetical protein n=1 Tax=Kribbella sp. ALI-6-A TaxID=1933817 RepID=UPI001179BE47|nr:hypothetical protein [Kribbella sp. ALI-6-A]